MPSHASPPAGDRLDAAPAGESVRSVAADVLALEPPGVLRVGIDGVDGAGKTTFADRLAGALGASGRQVIRVSADDFLNPAAIRHARGRDSPEGFFADSYDDASLRRHVLDPLGPGGSRRFRRRAFDLAADRPVEAPLECAAEDAILVLDGLFLHRDELCDAWDYSVFLEVPFEVSIARCAARSAGWASADPAAPSNRRYVEGQRIYLARCSPTSRATRVIDNSGAQQA